MGWNEWPLMCFTVLAQTALGAFWWCSYALLVAKLPDDQRMRLERGMIVIWGMVLLGFMFSSAHLGSPFRAINAILRFGHAPLSNEVVFGSTFAGLGILRWWLVTQGRSTAAIHRNLLLLTLILSLGFFWGMSTFYLMPTVPTWNTPLTPLAFALTALIGGSMVAATLFAQAGIDVPNSALRHGPMTMASIACIAAVFVTLAQSSALPSIASSIKHASELSPNYAALMSMRFLLVLSALALWFRPTRQGQVLSVNTGILCSLLALLGEWIGRGVFYGLYMTVGLL